MRCPNCRNGDLVPVNLLEDKPESEILSYRSAATLIGFSDPNALTCTGTNDQEHFTVMPNGELWWVSKNVDYAPHPDHPGGPTWEIVTSWEAVSPAERERRLQEFVNSRQKDSDLMSDYLNGEVSLDGFLSQYGRK